MNELARGLELEQAGDLDGAKHCFLTADERNEPAAALGLARIAEARGDDQSAESWFRRAGDLELARTGSLEWWMVRPASEMNLRELRQVTREFGFRQRVLSELLESLSSQPACEREELTWQRARADQRLLETYTKVLLDEMLLREKQLDNDPPPMSDFTENGGTFGDDDGRPCQELDGFVTVLGDAYLVEDASSGYGPGYSVVGTASGETLCSVSHEIAARARSYPQRPVLLGSWSATFRGVRDEWRIWHALDVIWASSGNITEPGEVVPLIEHFCAEAERAEAQGRVHNPDPVSMLASRRSAGRTQA